MKTSVVFLFICVVVCGGAAALGQNYYFSLDIGSDLEMDDPITPGPIDPGCIYAAPYALGNVAIKFDEQIFNGMPPPPPPAIIYPGDIVDYTNFFDLDGEDQLLDLIMIEGEPHLIETNASMGTGLWKNPHVLYISYDDDGAPGWPINDIPVLVTPTHGQAAPYDEILSGTVWRAWTLIGAADEDALGLTNNPVAGDDTFDDDVDALDVEFLDWWYWTCDHEACGDGQGGALDPGAIYVTSLSVPGYMPAIPQAFLGLIDDPATPIIEDADVDAFEFCTTDDPEVLQFFAGTIPGHEYLAVLFSVDQDDPLTANVDESGGLMPHTVYISLLTGEPPMVLAEYDEDIDAIAVYGTGEQEDEYDFGDAPDTPYPTLLVNNGARHRIVSHVFMGLLIDAEADGQPNASATLDDTTNLKDEDGVSFTTLLVPGQGANVDVVASVAGSLSAWIDFNADGSWGAPGENIFAAQALTAGVNHLTFTVPPGLLPTNTFARFRFTTNQVSLNYTGLVDNGEVEDYEVIIRADEEGDHEVCPKWIQPPDCDAGLDMASAYSFSGDTLPVVADDWWCDGRPVSGIKWWGSYIGYATNTG
ncbi:MAG: hypothetical protein EOM20_20675, partial [Spartobacteria bacterium]|nr:hypothetical protein [Spartobacteria bacterium]